MYIAKTEFVGIDTIGHVRGLTMQVEFVDGTILDLTDRFDTGFDPRMAVETNGGFLDFPATTHIEIKFSKLNSYPD